ncbi:hypothetical protein Tbis_1159 [Thermobispora bispora DSM 43833]|uniref:Uncharacterized protein n=1 Tax=Thermobispora bispora (strain ATCC 19993 / DSM 43833 / CBS 139.67 / JCM 10125 / KCTC 9307 / NBRC 14880 / R51) TaxID=469371 RepID=D6Y8I4_THEBD|nr:hypothetical protein Tbis_1159 [Thermobispora bispora DSM 43833]
MRARRTLRHRSRIRMLPWRKRREIAGIRNVIIRGR